MKEDYFFPAWCPIKMEYVGHLGTPIELTLAAFVGLPILVVVLECLSMVMELDVNSEDENKNENKKESPLSFKQ